MCVCVCVFNQIHRFSMYVCNEVQIICVSLKMPLVSGETAVTNK